MPKLVQPKHAKRGLPLIKRSITGSIATHASQGNGPPGKAKLNKIAEDDPKKIAKNTPFSDVENRNINSSLLKLSLKTSTKYYYKKHQAIRPRRVILNAYTTLHVEEVFDGTLEKVPPSNPEIFAPTTLPLSSRVKVNKPVSSCCAAKLLNLYEKTLPS